jgi:hypothetical protein
VGWRPTSTITKEAGRPRIVPSPPCGMATLKNHGPCPQGPGCSKPTVWDGDDLQTRVPSPPCGMDVFQIIIIRSKPTVWDGDSRIPNTQHILIIRSISPPCLTRFYNYEGSLWRRVPSPPCGMATSEKQSGGPHGTTVPSPPCGMATIQFIGKGVGYLSSEPTVWDGDTKGRFLSLCPSPRFQAHRVGWRLGMSIQELFITQRSKPTVWDGDV